MTLIKKYLKLTFKLGMIWICTFLLSNSVHSQGLELTTSKLKTIILKNQKWYTPYKDSTYINQDTICIQSNLDFVKSGINRDVYIWSFLNKKKIGFYHFNSETAVSVPMRVGVKYKIEEKNAKMYLTIKHNNLKVNQYQVININRIPESNDYKIQLIKTSGNNIH